MTSSPIENAAVVVEGDSIVAVGKFDEVRAAHTGETRDLGEVVLLPGLINAHCHLDYTDMVGEVEWRGSFIEWVLQLVALKRLRSEKEYRAGIKDGIKQLLRTGTTTVINVEAFPELIAPVLADDGPRLRVWWCLELMDVPQSATPEEIVNRAMNFVAERRDPIGGVGLSPHAPYTASAELYRMAAYRARARGLLLTTHLAESQEEDDMFRRGTGHMYDYFSRAGRDMSDCKRTGVCQLMSEWGVLGSHCLAVHANCLTPLDVKLLGDTRTHVVHCPNSHRFFGRGTPMLGALRAAGVNVCLGTDSLASNDRLDMFREMRTLTHIFPELDAEEVLGMATTSGAKALNLSDKLGRIAPGAWADVIAVPLDNDTTDPYEAVVYADQPVVFSMVNGKAVLE